MNTNQSRGVDAGPHALSMISRDEQGEWCKKKTLYYTYKNKYFSIHSFTKVNLTTKHDDSLPTTYIYI